MGWEFLASSGPTVVLMTNSEEHLGVPRSISSLGRLGTTADAMRPLISVSTSDGAPAKQASESGSCQEDHINSILTTLGWDVVWPPQAWASSEQIRREVNQPRFCIPH